MALMSWTPTKNRHRNIDALDTTKASGARADKGSTDPSHKSKKMSREGGNTATTTQSPDSLATPSPRRDTIKVNSPSSKHATMATYPPETERVMEVSMSPLAFLGGDMQFTRGVRLTLPKTTRKVIQDVPSSDLLREA